MTKKKDLITTIEQQRNIIVDLRNENMRLRDILKRNGINVDAGLPDWMVNPSNVIYEGGKSDIVAIL